MRIFIQTTNKGETITWYGFSESDQVEVMQHILVTKFMLDTPVGFNDEDGTVTAQYTRAVNDHLNLNNPN